MHKTIQKTKYTQNKKTYKTKIHRKNTIKHNQSNYKMTKRSKYEGRTESHEQLFFTCELGTADEGECGGRWNQLLCYP